MTARGANRCMHFLTVKRGRVLPELRFSFIGYIVFFQLSAAQWTGLLHTNPVQGYGYLTVIVSVKQHHR